MHRDERRRHQLDENEQPEPMRQGRAPPTRGSKGEHGQDRGGHAVAHEDFQKRRHGDHPYPRSFLVFLALSNSSTSANSSRNSSAVTRFTRTRFVKSGCNDPPPSLSSSASNWR